MRSRQTVLSGVGVLLFLASPTWAALGDVNGDGRVDAADVQMLDTYLDGSTLLTDEQIAASDVDGDGNVTRRDREALARRVGGITVRGSTERGSAQVALQSAGSGRVVDRETGQPLAGVEVAIPDEGIVVRTDSEGRFQLPASARGKILTARSEKYAPFSLTVRDDGRGFDLGLERLSGRLTVLDDTLHHLGDDNFSRTSANAGEFRRRAEGTEYRRSFSLSRPPGRDLILRIGSIIGIDTAASKRAGQSRSGGGRSGVAVYLNGAPLTNLQLNGDNLRVVLPAAFLRPGVNEVRLVTDFQGFSSANLGSVSGLGAIFGLNLGFRGSMGDYDDIEFANLVLEDPEGVIVGR